VPPFVLTVLKILLLLLLYFFLYRAVRSITADLYPRGRERRRREPRAARARSGRGRPGRVVVLGPEGKKVGTYRLEGPLQIGRDSTCEIRPPDTYISQVHARLAPRGDGWVIEDMGSTNGTYLNQRKVQVPTRIAPGDRIRIGKTVLEVRK